MSGVGVLGEGSGSVTTGLHYRTYLYCQMNYLRVTDSDSSSLSPLFGLLCSHLFLYFEAEKCSGDSSDQMVCSNFIIK